MLLQCLDALLVLCLFLQCLDALRVLQVMLLRLT
jgi:hypothetical protein